MLISFVGQFRTAEVQNFIKIPNKLCEITIVNLKYINQIFTKNFKIFEIPVPYQIITVSKFRILSDEMIFRSAIYINFVSKVSDDAFVKIEIIRNISVFGPDPPASFRQKNNRKCTVVKYVLY